MKRAIILASAALACLSLSACATANTDPAAVLKALGEAYGHCERIVSYSASIGALNPGSGATINGQVRCPPKTPSASPEPSPDETSAL